MQMASKLPSVKVARMGLWESRNRHRQRWPRSRYNTQCDSMGVWICIQIARIYRLFLGMDGLVVCYFVCGWVAVVGSILLRYAGIWEWDGRAFYWSPLV